MRRLERVDQIPGARLTSLVTHVDDRGQLTVVLRNDQPDMARFGQVYLVGSPAAGTIRAWHRHSRMWDWFFICRGSAKFGLVDDRPGSPVRGAFATVALSERAPALLAVPPGVFHGWMSLEDDTQLLSTADHRYDEDGWDEERLPHDHFAGFPWYVEHH